MASLFELVRRRFLLGTGLALLQSLVPARLLAGPGHGDAPGPGSDKGPAAHAQDHHCMPHGILPHHSNPFFNPVGEPYGSPVSPDAQPPQPPAAPSVQPPQPPAAPSIQPPQPSAAPSIQPFQPPLSPGFQPPQPPGPPSVQPPQPSPSPPGAPSGPLPPPFHGGRVSDAAPLPKFALPSDAVSALGAAGAAVAAVAVGARKAERNKGGESSRETSSGDADARPETPADALPATAALVAAAATVAVGSAEASPTPSTLVLYDWSGPWAWTGELYAIMAANLSSHFGTWTAMPVSAYTRGLLGRYTAVIYVGSTYDEPLSNAFLDDVYNSTTTRIIWLNNNIWKLTQRFPGFAAKYGWMWSGYDTSSVGEVDYKSYKLKRYAPNAAGIMNYSAVGPNVTVVANCVRADSTVFPWAVSSQNLTYIGENPLVYTTEGDRYLIFCDLLFDALAPSTPTRRRACIRLEDIDPTWNTNNLKAFADWLYSQNVPFGFQIIPRYLDGKGTYNNGVPQDILLRNQSAMIAAIQYMQGKGGVLMEHGYTHQYDATNNPYTGVTGDDAEYYRITQNADGTLNFVGPVPEDTSTAWAAARFNAAAAEFQAAGFAVPAIHTFPNYSASVRGSTAAAAAFPVRSERVLYFPGLLSAQPIDYSRVAGQFFPYTVKDVYANLARSNSKVLPDTLGGFSPAAFGPYPARTAVDIVADAQRTLAVRDGVAFFFYHPYNSITDMQAIVNGIKALGYTFVSPASL